MSNNRNDPLINMTGLSRDGVAVAYPQSAWTALLEGDLDAALAAEAVLVDAETGEPLPPARAEQLLAAWATAEDRPNPLATLAQDFWREYEAKHGASAARAHAEALSKAAAAANSAMVCPFAFFAAAAAFDNASACARAADAPCLASYSRQKS